VNLLHDQELYEENPAWKPFQPMVPGQPEAKKPAAPPSPQPFPSSSAPFIPPLPAAPASAGPAPARPSPADAGLAPALQQALDAQSRMVDRLFDELQDLSRRIDQGPRTAPPRAVPPALAAPPPEPPWVPPTPGGSEPSTEGMPRWAVDAAEEPETGPEAAGGEIYEEPEPGFAEPEVLRELAAEPTQAAPTEAGESEEAAAPEIEGAEPADWLPDIMPTGTPSVAAPAPAVPELPEDLEIEEEAEAEPAPELPSEVAAGPPPLPEPEDLETLEEVREQPAAESEEPEGKLRQQLRRYIRGVRERLEALPPATPVAEAGPKLEDTRATGALLDYLAKLSEYLPERERSRFLESDVQLSIERLRSHLSGRHGQAGISDELPRVATAPLTRLVLLDAFSYLQGLAQSIPDPGKGARLARRIEEVKVRIGGAG
jgi:hypothetical protein